MVAVVFTINKFEINLFDKINNDTNLLMGIVNYKNALCSTNLLFVYLLEDFHLLAKV